MAEKILLVDDQPKNIQVAGTLLSSKGYEVEFATDGLRALEWLAEESFDLVLLDVMMPGMDGYETCRKLKQMPNGPDIPVIFLTAKSDTDSLVEGFAAGGVDYLTKPFQAEELLVRVRTHLEMKQMREKLKDVNKWLQAEVGIKTMELMEANQHLKDALGKVESLDSSKDNFLRIISHEIRTPLNGIIGASQLLKMMISTPDQQEFFDMLEVSLKRLESFSFTALEITELKASGKEIPRQKLNLAEFIKESAQISRIDHERKFILESDGVESISINKELLLTAIVKLFDNALRFSPAGSSVILKVQSESRGVHFTLTDQGQGFPQEVLLRKFEPFVTGATHIDKNPGLSLPMVKFVIESHGGEIDLHNHAEGGAVVEFYIPQG